MMDISELDFSSKVGNLCADSGNGARISGTIFFQQGFRLFAKKF
jgi:hypothetical protein